MEIFDYNESMVRAASRFPEKRLPKDALALTIQVTLTMTDLEVLRFVADHATLENHVRRALREIASGHGQ
ncbi:MAG: hypothetical protein IJJ33_02765 [Victivallales bacterium]|nr:hypothetical protein [Victivallales bacterium]